MRQASNVGVQASVCEQGQSGNRVGPNPHSRNGIGARSRRGRSLRPKTEGSADQRSGAMTLPQLTTGTAALRGFSTSNVHKNERYG